jgi:hypothetical protein
MTHTPTPWTISRLATPDYAPEFGIFSGDSAHSLARVIGENSEADARLIAAAPDLLAALEECVTRLAALDYRIRSLTDADTDYELGEVMRSRAAIAKAKGE